MPQPQAPRALSPLHPMLSGTVQVPVPPLLQTSELGQVEDRVTSLGSRTDGYGTLG